MDREQMKLLLNAFTLILLSIVPAFAQGTPTQWNYSFNNDGTAVATYPGIVNIPYNPIAISGLAINNVNAGQAYNPLINITLNQAASGDALSTALGVQVGSSTSPADSERGGTPPIYSVVYDDTLNANVHPPYSIGSQSSAIAAINGTVVGSNGSHQTFAVQGRAYDCTPPTPGPSSATDKVGIYGEAQRTGACVDGIWGMNSITESTNLNGPIIGDEKDIANMSGTDPTIDPPHSMWGMSIVSSGNAPWPTGIVLEATNSPTNAIERGIYMLNVSKIGLEIGNTFGVFQDTLNAGILGQQINNGDYGILWARRTDTSPTGRFIDYVNAGNTMHLFTVENNGGITSAAGITIGSTTLISSSVALSNGAASSTATMTNAPTAGNPTKWIPINDNGTTRYIPAW